MSNLNSIKNKIYRLEELKVQINSWRDSGDKIVFTNGCFDLLHRGHVEMLARTSDLAQRLIIGLNSDESIKALKGENRPIENEESRAILLASLSFVDAVILFTEETPLNLIHSLIPDILAKGGDYEVETIVGHKIIKNNGGEVIVVPFIDGYSSTKIINKIKKY